VKPPTYDFSKDAVRGGKKERDGGVEEVSKEREGEREKERERESERERVCV
jgi:hypothetical protein